MTCACIIREEASLTNSAGEGREGECGGRFVCWLASAEQSLAREGEAQQDAAFGVQVRVPFLGPESSVCNRLTHAAPCSSESTAVLLNEP